MKMQNIFMFNFSFFLSLSLPTPIHPPRLHRTPFPLIIASDEEEPTSAGKVLMLLRLFLFNLVPLLIDPSLPFEVYLFRFQPKNWHSFIY